MKVQIFKQNDFSEIYLDYKPELIALVKSIEGAKYESIPVKKWTISTSELENLISKFKVLHVDVEYTDRKDELIDTTPLDNQMIEVSIENNQCFVKLPVPKKIFSDLYKVPKTITKTHWIISNSHFSAICQSCYKNKVKLNLN